MPLASLPTEISGRNRVWRRVVTDAIRNDPEWKNGEYTTQPQSLAERPRDPDPAQRTHDRPRDAHPGGGVEGIPGGLAPADRAAVMRRLTRAYGAAGRR